MDPLESMIVRFYDNGTVLSKQERSQIENGMLSFINDAANIRKAFDLLQIRPDRDLSVYMFAADSLAKIIRKHYSDLDDVLKNYLRDELFKTLLQFNGHPNNVMICNRILISISAFVVRSTEFWPTSVKDSFGILYVQAKNQQWIFKFFTNVAEEFAELKSSERPQVHKVLSQSSENLIKFISDTLPKMSPDDCIADTIKCLEVWSIKFEISDPDMIDIIIETLLRAIACPHQSEPAHNALYNIFQQPVFEKCENLFQMLFHEMFGQLQPVIDAKLKENAPTDHLKNIFEFFLNMGKLRFEILYKMDDSVRLSVISIYLNTIVSCTPVCIKSIDPYILFDFWEKVFTEKIENVCESLMQRLDDICFYVVQQSLELAKYDHNFLQLSEDDRDLFIRYRKALANTFDAFYNQIGRKMFQAIIDLLAHANNLFKEGRFEWIFYLELTIFYAAEIGVNIREEDPEIVAVFNAITDVPFDHIATFPPIFRSILSFLKRYLHLFNHDPVKNRKMFLFITGIMKKSNAEILRKGMFVLNSLNDNGYENIEAFLPQLIQFYHEAINASQLPLDLKIELSGSFCHLIRLCPADVSLNSFKTAILPFLEKLNTTIRATPGDAKNVHNVIKLYAKIFDKLTNPNFVAELFDFFEHMRADLEEFIDRFQANFDILETICQCFQAYLLNVGDAAEEQFHSICKMLIQINRYHHNHVLKTIRICLCRFPTVNLFNEAFIEILNGVQETFHHKFGDDPELIEIFYEELGCIVRKTKCQIPSEMLSNFLAYSMQAIQLNEQQASKSAAYFIRDFVQSIEKDPSIQAVFQKHFQQLVDMIFKILLNQNSFSSSVDLVCDTFFLFKKSYPSNFLIAINNSNEPMIPTEKNNLLKFLSTCNNKSVMKKTLIEFATKHQNC